MRYFVKQELSPLTAIVSFSRMVLKRVSLMMAYNVPQLVAYYTYCTCAVGYDCIIGNTVIPRLKKIIRSGITFVTRNLR